MRNALPGITEDAALLTPRLHRAHAGRKDPRLQTLYLWASGPAPTRQAAAQRLGVHRQSMGHWLAIDAAGGLEALLAL